ncbi:MAG: hypothetical protein M0R17_04860 [Candidatus Omnitrophica bacterium]|jgi:hypothetical protein|nr:hypothetical protein [Candidatus Omnitrophota bacterium]
MNIKRRFKRALFSFFKDEIESSLNINKFQEATINYYSEQIDFKELEIKINFIDKEYPNKPANYVYMESLLEAKRRLFDEVCKYIKIDNKSIMDERIWNAREIKANLFVGIPN